MTPARIRGMRHAFKLHRARQYVVLNEAMSVIRVWAISEARAREITVELTGSPAAVVEAVNA